MYWATSAGLSHQQMQIVEMSEVEDIGMRLQSNYC